MSTKAQPTPETETPTVTLPAPKRGFQYVEVPDDLHKSTFDLPGLYALCRLEYGGMLDDFDTKLAKVVAKCMSLGKKGSIALTLHFKPEGSKKMEISAKVDPKAPKDSTPSTYLFATERGQLLEKDPDQRELDLRIVSLPARRAARDVLDADG